MNDSDNIDSGLWERNLCSININGLLVRGGENKTELEVILKEENIDILLIQETKLVKDTCVSETFIEGYVELRLVREGRGGGGVSTYLRNGVGILGSNGFSNGWMEILTVVTKDTLYANIYKSPAISVEAFKDSLDFLYKEIEGK